MRARLTRPTLLCVTSAMLLLGGSPGIRPRAVATDYPAHQSTNDFAIGAALIPTNEVRKIFAADLNSGYVVVEIGVYPLQSTEIDLSPADFTLLVDRDRIAERPVDPDAIASVIGRRYDPPKLPDPADVYVTTGASIGTGTSVDPNTGRRTRGLETGAGVGVGVGAPPPGSCRGWNCENGPYPTQAPHPAPASPNRGAMEQELWAKSLPDGKTTSAVAGYLYFPKPSGKAKNGPWELTRDGASGRVKLSLQNPAKR
jgi:hypothetical protein